MEPQGDTGDLEGRDRATGSWGRGGTSGRKVEPEGRRSPAEPEEWREEAQPEDWKTIEEVNKAEPERPGSPVESEDWWTPLEVREPGAKEDLKGGRALVESRAWRPELETGDPLTRTELTIRKI